MSCGHVLECSCSGNKQKGRDCGLVGFGDKEGNSWSFSKNNSDCDFVDFGDEVSP